MKKTLILLLACCACIRSQAQTPEAAAAPEPSVTRTDSTLTFPEPEFIGQALAIRPDNRTEQLVQERQAVRTYEQRTTIRYQVSEISAFYPDCW